ncbi:MAG: RNA pyrophosphohydrolase [Verrucomicrobiales bacterium]|jgi:putative (di)nucleoside polyphosphate hydrolase|nr:RNA pyrophosphohydrolase [Verrucomicrobiales bacterium]
MATYRPNVAAILRKPKSGKILIAERISNKGSWQFPQGGVDKGEDLIGALFREVEEEIGVGPDKYKITAARTAYRYKFPRGHLKKKQFCGQVQTYFLCDYYGKKNAIDLDAHVREFSQYKWIKPENFPLKGVPKFKRPVFKRVFKDFFGVELKMPRKKKGKS